MQNRLKGVMYVYIVDTNKDYFIKIRKSTIEYLKDSRSSMNVGYKVVKTFEIAQEPELFFAVSKECNKFVSGDISLSSLEKRIEDLKYYFGNTPIRN